MPRNRFAVPSTVRLEFGDGSDDWIEVKTELTYGEGLDLSVAAAPRDGESNLGWIGRYYPARAATWLVDWSFCGADGNAVELAEKIEDREEQIRALDTETGREIQRLLAEHEDSMDVSNLGKDAAETGMTTPEAPALTDETPLPPKNLRRNTAA